MSYYKIDLLRYSIKKGFMAFCKQTYLIIRSVLSPSNFEKVFCMNCDELSNISSAFDLNESSITIYDFWDAIPVRYQQILKGRETRGIFWDTEEWISRGRQIWIGSIDNELAVIGFTSPGNKVTDFYFPMTSRCILSNYIFTMPQYRGRGLMSLMLKYTIYKSHEEGYERVYGYADEFNISSISCMEKIGFRHIGNGKTNKSTGKRIWYQKI